MLIAVLLLQCAGDWLLVFRLSHVSVGSTTGTFSRAVSDRSRSKIPREINAAMPEDENKSLTSVSLNYGYGDIYGTNMYAWNENICTGVCADV